MNRSQGKFLQTMPCQHTQQFIKYSKKHSNQTQQQITPKIWHTCNTLQKCGLLNFGVGPQFYYFRSHMATWKKVKFNPWAGGTNIYCSQFHFRENESCLQKPLHWESRAFLGDHIKMLQLFIKHVELTSFNNDRPPKVFCHWNYI